MRSTEGTIARFKDAREKTHSVVRLQATEKVTKVEQGALTLHCMFDHHELEGREFTQSLSLLLLVFRP